MVERLKSTEYMPEEKQALMMLGYYIINGDSFTPDHARIILNILANQEIKIKIQESQLVKLSEQFGGD